MFTPMFPVRTQQHVVSAGFFERAGFQILSGREFNNQDAATRHVVVNDTFAGMAFQGQPSIGKRIQVGGLRGPWYTVVGVVKDIPISGLIAFDPEGRNVVRAHRADRQPAIYFSAQEKTPAVFEVITERPFNVQIAGVRLLQSQRLPALLAEARSPVRWFAGLLGTLSVAAALIAVLSLGALTLLNVQQRRLEIAARRAVGARRRDILLMVLRTSAATAARGIFAGIILSVAIARAIQMLVPQMKLFDLEVTLLSALLLTIISLIAASIPARAAARVPPARVHA
jgi:putative ABC transport system permease protein